MKILIAEDEPIMFRTMEFRLKKDGHEITGARDGFVALEILASVVPDLVITDLHMPGASGFEVLAFIRENLGLNIPVILLTGTGEEEVIRQAFLLGATDYIRKPFSPNALSAMVAKYGCQ
jgi:CheY-like chemotaxis protein